MSEVLDLSSDAIWRDERFRSMIFNGLKSDGVSDDVVSILAGWTKEIDPQTHDQFFTGIDARIERLPAAQRESVKTACANLRTVGDTNSSIYHRDSPEKTRVIQWPNNPSAKWDDPAHYFDIFTDYFYRIPHRIIDKKTPIGSAGSCFAVRIAHQLQLWGYNYILEEDDLPADIPLERLTETNFRTAPARCGNLFNVPSMRQMVERAFGEWTPGKLLAKDGKKFIDPFRAEKALYKDEAGFLEDYQRHTDALKRALLKCDVFILTLGLTEAWYFAHSDEYTSIAPWKVDPHLLRRKNLTVEDNVSELERLFAVYRKHNPRVKLIISVSPVPLNKTFSADQHVVEANSLSKATLRVAADEFVRRHLADAFYFPSYEMVMFGTRRAWEADQRHVSPDAVERVMGLFQRQFLVDQTPLPVARPLELAGDVPVKQKARAIARKVKRMVKSAFRK